MAWHEKKKHSHAEKIYYDDEVLLILGHLHREIYYIQKIKKKYSSIAEKFHTEHKWNLQKRELNDTFCYDEKVSNSILFFIFSRLLHDSWNLMMKRSLSLLL